MRDLFFRSADYFFKSISSHNLDFGKIGKAYMTGVATPTLNPLFIFNNEAHIDNTIAEAIKFYNAHQLPWSLIIPEDLALQLDILNFTSSMKNFYLAHQSNCMFIDLRQYHHTSLNIHLEIRHVNNHLDEWIIPLIEAFDSTPAIGYQYLQAHQKTLDSKASFYHLTANLSNQPVSSLSLSQLQEVIRIDDVGTLPAYQKKGFATTLLRYALNKAIELGARYCVLESSPEGRHMYEKIGFKSIFINNIYSLEE